MMNHREILEWQLAAGVDETTSDTPVNHFAPKSQVALAQITLVKPAAPTPSPVLSASISTPLHLSPIAAASAARALADSCNTREELEEIVRKFDGCAIKKTATKTVFSDGNPKAQIMLIGEAPGAQEDVQGIPFCGASGKLLDKMFASIGLDRNSVYISNTIFWRPPANRQPSEIETTTCLPFVEKHIALIAPKLLILSGGTATTTLLKKDSSISRLRGKFYEYQNCYMNEPVKTVLIYHPSYLLRQPLYKKQAWQDLLMVKKCMETQNSQAALLNEESSVSAI